MEEISNPGTDIFLEGVLTKVAAFVDIGVHQDGLAHISALSNTFVKDSHTAAQAGYGLLSRGAASANTRPRG